MFTEKYLYGMNLLTIAGLAVMGIGLTLNRQGQLRAPATVAIMGAGTALVFAGLYFAAPAGS